MCVCITGQAEVYSFEDVVYMCTYIYTHVCKHMYMYIHMYNRAGSGIQFRVDMYKHMYMYIHIYTHVCIHTHMCIYLCITGPVAVYSFEDVVGTEIADTHCAGRSVAVYCSVLQRVAVCCSRMKCVASVLQVCCRCVASVWQVCCKYYVFAM